MSEESKDRILEAPADLPFAESCDSAVDAQRSESLAPDHVRSATNMINDSRLTPHPALVEEAPLPKRESWATTLNEKRRVTLAQARDKSKHSRIAKRAACIKQIVDLVTAGEYSTSVLARKLRISKPTLLDMCKEKGINLKALRDKTAHAMEEATKDEADTEPAAEEGLICSWGWSILQLFDRLQPFFDLVEAAKDTDDAEELELPKEETRSTWIAWRVFLAAAFGIAREALAVDWDKEKLIKFGYRPAYPVYQGLTADVTRGAANLQPGATAQGIYEACTGRLTWPEVQARLVSLIVGRRGGKSYITAIIGIYLACCRTYRLKLGTKGMVMILARDKEQAGVIRGYILAFLKAVPELALMLSDTPNQKLIELKNGLTIEVRAVSEGGTRGYTVVAALMDEIAFWPTDPESAKQDKKILRALRPAMFGIKNTMIVMLSSPYAQRGVLYENHSKDYARDGAKGFVWQADTLSMRPEQDDELLDEIRDLYDEDPESAKAEYGAQFRNDLESIFTKTSIEGVGQPGRIEQMRSSKHRYRVFVDPSGGSSDSYVAAVAHDEKRTIDGDTVTFAVLDKVIEWVPKFDPAQVSREVVQLCKDFGVKKVTGDAYGGEWPRDPLKKAGIEYELSEMSRSELYLAFLPMVNSKRCELLDLDHHKRLLNQLVNLERRVGRTGKDTIDHPPGSHDDVGNAVAGVLVTPGGSGGIRCTWDEDD